MLLPWGCIWHCIIWRLKGLSFGNGEQLEAIGGLTLVLKLAMPSGVTTDEAS